MVWRLLTAVVQVILANPQLLNTLLSSIKEFVELVKEIWGEDGRNVVALEDVEQSRLLDGRSGGLIELIKWLLANPEALRVILEFLRAIGVLKS